MGIDYKFVCDTCKKKCSEEIHNQIKEFNYFGIMEFISWHHYDANRSEYDCKMHLIEDTCYCYDNDIWSGIDSKKAGTKCTCHSSYDVWIKEKINENIC